MPKIDTRYGINTDGRVVIMRGTTNTVMTEQELRDTCKRILERRSDYAREQAWRDELAVWSGALDFGLINCWRKRK